MVVVADSTPLHYLTLIGEIYLLHELYGAIVVPNAVTIELTHPRTPAAVRKWIDALPNWASIAFPASSLLQFADSWTWRA